MPDIKQNLSILKVLAHYNHVPDKNNLLNCPFYEDKTASLQVYTKINTYHCFGCDKTGGVIQWIENYEKVNKHEAILKEKELIGLSAETNVKAGITQPLKEIQPLSTMQETFTKLQQSLQRSQKAKDYLQDRNLDFTNLLR